MKKDWEYKKLGDVCIIRTGKLDVNAQDPNGKYPFFTCDSKPYLINTYAFDDEAILISGNGSKVGHIHYYNGKFNAYQRTYVLTNFNYLSPQFLSKFLKGYLRSHIYATKKGGCIPFITIPLLKNFIIPVPPLAEQKRIVEELDLLSGIIEKQKQQLKELDTLAQSIFYDMFGDPITNEKGWKVKKMKEVAPSKEFIGEITKVKNKYWLLNLDKVESHSGKILSKDYYDSNEIGSSTITFDESNILYSKLRPYLNKVVIPNDTGYATSELVPLKPDYKILNRIFLAYLLRSVHFVSYISIKVVGAKMPRVSMEELRNFKVILPPLPLQNLFASKIEAIEKQKEAITKSIEETQKLFDYTMDKYFG